MTHVLKDWDICPDTIKMPPSIHNLKWEFPKNISNIANGDIIKILESKEGILEIIAGCRCVGGLEIKITIDSTNWKILQVICPSKRQKKSCSSTKDKKCQLIATDGIKVRSSENSLYKD